MRQDHLHTVCDVPIGEVSVNLVDDNNLAGDTKWKVRAAGEPATAVILNAPSDGYERGLAGDGSVPERFGVSFAFGASPTKSAMVITRSKMRAGARPANPRKSKT